MKADPKTQNEVTQTLKGMFVSYKKKDLEGVLSFWAPDPDIVVIGSGFDEKSVGIDQFIEHLKRDWSQAEVLTISFKDYTVSAAGPVAWFSADINFHCTIDEQEVDLPGRLTGIMEKRNERWLWVQMHFSTPNIEQVQGKSWPKH